MKLPWDFCPVFLLLISAAFAQDDDYASTKEELKFLQDHKYFFPSKERTEAPTYQQILHRIQQFRQTSTDGGGRDSVENRLGQNTRERVTLDSLIVSDSIDLENEQLEKALQDYEDGVDQTDELVVSLLLQGEGVIADLFQFKATCDVVVSRLQLDQKRRSKRRFLSLPRRHSDVKGKPMEQLFGPIFGYRYQIDLAVQEARYHTRLYKERLSEQAAKFLSRQVMPDYEEVASGMKLVHELENFDDDKQMIHRISTFRKACRSETGTSSSEIPHARCVGHRQPAFSKPQIQKAIAVAQQTAILANAVRYHMVSALSHLLVEGYEYEEYYYRELVKEAAGSGELKILKMLLQFSGAAENFGAALFAAVRFKIDVLQSNEALPNETLRDKNEQVINFLLLHQRSIYEAYKLAFFEGGEQVIAELRRIQGQTYHSGVGIHQGRISD